MIIGLKNIHIAELTAEQENTYGTVDKLSPAISANITPNSSVTTLYGDDHAVAVEETLGSINVEINTADLTPEQYAKLMGVTVNDDGVIEDSTNDIAPYVALGFELPKSGGGKKLYWYYKGRFQKPGGEFNTKGETVAFATQTLVANFMAREDGKWRAHHESLPADVDKAIADAWFETVYAPTVAPVV